MKIDLRELEKGPVLLKGQAGTGFLELESVGARALGPVEYHLEVCRAGGSVEIEGSLRLELELECVCCLGRFPFLLQVPEFSLSLAPTELREIGQLLDLTPYIREDILLELPAYPKCDWESQKVCPAQFDSTAAAPLGGIPEGSQAWSVLDSLSGSTPQSPRRA